jgi:hypothetical protein
MAALDFPLVLSETQHSDTDCDRNTYPNANCYGDTNAYA